MSNLNKQINACLGKMKSISGPDKGVFGEDAAFKVCESLYQERGGLLYHSFEYPVVPGIKGNIKREDNGTLRVENLGSHTELDILYATENRIFLLEVKSYKAKKITLFDDRIEGCYMTNKCPTHQNEMHARHLYEHIFSVIPNGKTGYFVSIVVFVDKCEVSDKRSLEQRDYVKLAVLNTLRGTIDKFDKPLNSRIDLFSLERKLNEIRISSKKYLPVRLID